MNVRALIFAVLIVVGVGAVGTLIHTHWPRPSQTGTSAAREFSPEPMNVQYPREPVTRWTPPSTSSSVVQSFPTLESKSIRFELDAKSGNPARMFRAYDLVWDCLENMRRMQPARTRSMRKPGQADPMAADYPVEFMKSVCGDLKESQWDDPATRLPLLLAGVKAGEHRALARLNIEAYAYKTIDPTSTEFKAILEEGRRVALDRADPFVLTEIAADAANPEQRLEALVASRAALQRLWGRPLYDHENDPELIEAKAAVREPQRTAAIQRGLDYVQTHFR